MSTDPRVWYARGVYADGDTEAALMALGILLTVLGDRPLLAGTADAVAKEMLRDGRDIGSWTGSEVLDLIKRLEVQP